MATTAQGVAARGKGEPVTLEEVFVPAPRPSTSAMSEEAFEHMEAGGVLRSVVVR